MLKFKFAKLVRDKIVSNQIKTGAKPKYKKLGKEAHISALVDKIMEEAEEIRKADSADLAAELADVKQALEDLIELAGVKDQVANAQIAKNAQSGPFKEGLFIDYVEIKENDEWVKYYRDNSDKYPEI